MSQVPAFPSDVWRQVETKTIESLAFVDRVEVTDPEGTAFGYNVSPEEAKAWSEGVYQQGHLYMFPAQGTGRFPYSKIEYPKLAGNYIKPVQSEVTGIIASTTSHAASHPRVEIHVRNGRISEIKGGGLYGEGLRLLQNYPGTQDKQWPMTSKPGYWWLYEAGMGTNPKYFKHPAEVLEGINLSERNVAGIVHWAFGTEVAMGPNKPGDWDARDHRVLGTERSADGPFDAQPQHAAHIPGAHPRAGPVGDAGRARGPEVARGRGRARARLALRKPGANPRARLRDRAAGHQRAGKLRRVRPPSGRLLGEMGGEHRGGQLPVLQTVSAVASHEAVGSHASGRTVRLAGVSKTYETQAARITALEKMNWSIGGGEAAALMGPSGCGKTTILNLLGGMDRPSEGEIWVNGENVAAMNERQLEVYRLRKVGFVFQFFNLIPSLSAIENLELPMLLAGVNADERRGRAEGLLDTVGLKAKGFKRPEELSGGEQQRVAVCLALVNDPPIILADEPTGNLDSHNAKVISSMLIDLATSRGKTVLVASHDPKVVEQFPRVYHMRDGAIQQVT